MGTRSRSRTLSGGKVPTEAEFLKEELSETPLSFSYLATPRNVYTPVTHHPPPSSLLSGSTPAMPPKKSIFRGPEAQHFQLVHRSQRDPLINDPDAGQRVLKPVERANDRKPKVCLS